MNKNREQGTGNREQLTEEERHEAATEEAATVGCPSLGIPKLPGGFDGVESGEAESLPLQNKDGSSITSGKDSASPLAVEELKKRGAMIKVCNDRSRARLTEVLSIAERVLIKTVHSDGYHPGQYGQDYRDLGKAICEIRKIIRDSVTDVDPDYEMLALQFARNSFDFSKFQEAMAAVSSMKETDFPGLYYTPGWLCDLAKKLQGRDNPLDPSAPEMKRGEGRLFKGKHNSACHGTYIYDRICINDAHIRATLHPDNGGLEQHAKIWIGDSQRCFCYCTFNETSHVKCDYVVRGMLAGIAKRLVYHHKNLIKRKAKWAAAKQQAHDNNQEVK